MKKFALAVSLTVFASTSFAGSMSKPVMEAPVIMEDTTAASSSDGLLVPLLLIITLAVASAG
ncbi:MAG: hypothetical protein P8M25_00840 [Paracoccaceae bacterium]|jgi:hypothetical protein|nr:hypothetical protein [Paracoccaceae bacterium]